MSEYQKFSALVKDCGRDLRVGVSALTVRISGYGISEYPKFRFAIFSDLGDEAGYFIWNEKINWRLEDGDLEIWFRES